MPKKYRICLISRSTLAHKRGGLERYAHTLGSVLAEAGHEVIMITSAHPHGIQEERIDGVQTHYVGGTVPGSYKGGFFVKTANTFFKLHQKKPFDVIHSHSYGALGVIKKTNVPVVATLHGVWFSETVYERDAFKTLSSYERARSLLDFPKIFLHHMAMHGFAKHVHKIIFDSSFSKNEFMRLHPSWSESRYHVAPAAVEMEDNLKLSKEKARAKLQLNGTPHIFSVSRLEATKGFQTALRAARGLPAVYLLGGEGAYASRLEEMCRDENIGNAVFLGRVSEENLPLYYRASDIFVYPELVHPAFGLSLAEAMAHGACVVASRRGALPEVVGDAGVLYAHNDEKELASVLTDLLKNPRKREVLGQKARKRIRERFTKELLVKNVVSVYDEILTRNPKPETRNFLVPKHLRILYITAECVPRNTGGSVHAYETAAHLAKRGVHVTLLCHKGKNQRASENINGVRIVRHDMRLAGKAFAPKAILKLPLLRESFDVVMERYYATSFLGSFFSSVKGAPLVLEVNNPHLEELKTKKEFPAALLPAAKAVSHLAFAKASLILTPNAGCVPEKFREKVFEIPWAVNTELFHPATRTSSKCQSVRDRYGLNGKWVAVYVGTFREWQAPDVLVDAAELLAREAPDFRLLLVGDGDWFDAVKEKIQTKKLQDVCILTGEQPYAQIPYFTGAARVGLAPFRLSDTMKRTGFYYSPLKIFEYMACGLPVVTADIPALRNVVEENKTGFFISQDGNAEEFSAALLNCMKLGGALDEMGMFAREAVERRFSWDAHAGTIIQKMEALMFRLQPAEARQ